MEVTIPTWVKLPDFKIRTNSIVAGSSRIPGIPVDDLAKKIADYEQVGKQAWYSVERL